MQSPSSDGPLIAFPILPFKFHHISRLRRKWKLYVIIIDILHLANGVQRLLPFTPSVVVEVLSKVVVI